MCENKANHPIASNNLAKTFDLLLHDPTLLGCSNPGNCFDDEAKADYFSLHIFFVTLELFHFIFSETEAVFKSRVLCADLFP